MGCAASSGGASKKGECLEDAQTAAATAQEQEERQAEEDRSRRNAEQSQRDEELARRLQGLCHECEMREATPGHNWCKQCYDRFLALETNLCAICSSAPPTPGYEMCRVCYNAQQGIGGHSTSLSDVGSSEDEYEDDDEYDDEHAPGGHADAGSGGAAAPHQGNGMGAWQLSVLPTRSFLGEQDALVGEEAVCTICQIEYEPGEQLVMLPACAHAFHADCVSSWLKKSSACPICMRDVRDDLETLLALNEPVAC